MFSLEKIQYEVFSGKDHQTGISESLYDSYFKYWYNYWTNEVGDGYLIEENAFHRQHKITVLKYEQEIIGMHFYSYYSLAKDKFSPYFKQYPIENLVELNQKSLSSMQTMEYLMINPDWSFKKTKMAFGQILVSLGMKHHELEKCKASITIARTDIGAISIAKKCNYSEYGQRFELYGNPVASMICVEPRVYPRKDVTEMTEYFWNKYIETITVQEAA